MVEFGYALSSEELQPRELVRCALAERAGLTLVRLDLGLDAVKRRSKQDGQISIIPESTR